jgi:DNA processing protein
MPDPLPWVALRRISELGRRPAWSLIQALGSPGAVLGASETRVAALVGPRAARALAAGRDPAAARGELEQARAAGLRCLVPGDPGFPGALLQIPDPPLVLYARGALPRGPALAVVGSRAATPRARAVARAWCAELAGAGVAIISGLAYGVDAAAHRGALDARGCTLAVLASGLDQPSPAGNRPLAREILGSGGGWLSEHPPGVAALPRHFPERNRLISGLARAVLLVEARVASGSLWTARHALEQGRDVLAVPGPVDTDLCRGSNELLRDGAAVALEPDDVALAVLGRATGARAAPEPPADPLLAALRDGPRAAEDLGRELGLGPAALAERLLELELAGAIERQGERVSRAVPRAGR